MIIFKEGVRMEIGLKYDENKPRWELGIPILKYLTMVIEVMTFGAKKYADNNWMLVEPKERYWAAAMRHMLASQSDWLDPESGLPHLAHALCSICFYMWKVDDNKGESND